MAVEPSRTARIEPGLCKSNRTAIDKTNRTNRTATNRFENKRKRTSPHLSEPKRTTHGLKPNERTQAQ